MPTHSTPGGGHQWGDHGKIYYGKDGKAKADRQGRAIKMAEALRNKGKKG